MTEARAKAKAKAKRKVGSPQARTAGKGGRDGTGRKHRNGATGQPSARGPWHARKLFIIPLLLLLVAIVALTGRDEIADRVGGGNGEQEPQGPRGAVDGLPEDVETVAAEEPAADDTLIFTVTDWECGVSRVGEGDLRQEARGEFCILSLTVENRGEGARSLDAGSQYLYDDDERGFRSSFRLATALESPLSEPIGPGERVEGRIAFDVPRDATIEFARLHDSAFSDGVLVDLR